MEWEASEYLTKYRLPILDSVSKTLPCITSKDEVHPQIDSLLRKPICHAQASVITAAVGCLSRRHRLWLRGECGVGKTYVATAASHLHASGRAYTGIVMCPGHLVEKWEDEICSTIKDAVVYQVDGWRSAVKVLDLVGSGRPEWIVVSRDRVKLGPSWTYACMDRGQLGPVCPICGDKLLAIEGFCRSCGEKLLTPGAPYKWYPHKILRRVRADYFIGDEAHELAGTKTDQSVAFGGLLSSAKNRLAMTGTLSNGTAESLFPTLFRLLPDVMKGLGFSWDRPREFVDRYGRIEKTVKYSVGSKSKRSHSKTAPGIMPSLFGDALLQDSIFLSLDQISSDLPKIERSVVPVPMDDRMRVDYDGMQHVFRREFSPMKAASHRGVMGCMLTTLMCWPDCPSGWSHIGYKDGEDVVAVLRPPEYGQSVTNKERELIKIIQQERACGRQVWVFCQFTGAHDVSARLSNVLKMAGLRCLILRRDTVAPKDRTKWISKNAPGSDVVISHPRLIQTGVDLFSKDRSFNFPTLIFYETGWITNELRQASSRSLRIGQWLGCKVLYLHYADTLEERCIQLMGRKIAAAESIEGSFSSDGLAAMSEDESVESALARMVFQRKGPGRGLLDAMNSILE